jgi:hypothetical protein
MALSISVREASCWRIHDGTTAVAACSFLRRAHKAEALARHRLDQSLLLAVDMNLQVLIVFRSEIRRGIIHVTEADCFWGSHGIQSSRPTRDVIVEFGCDWDRPSFG